ncbi:MAG TPA: sulfatase/phosphatase domain-containing protein, partial [Actinomycetota bacterium]|nr:sulfatase/phosphatase domain-containing protein [Actinomycetota bacterium]
FLGKRDTEQRNETEALLEVDRQVHAVVQALGTEASNTLFVFTSDNGLSWGEHRYFDKKNCEFEECHRVLMVVRYDPLTDPGGIGGRVDTSHAVLNIDIAPTASDAAGLTDAPAMDGRSLLPLLDASAANDSPDWRTAWLGEDYGGLIACAGCVKTPTLKLIRTMPSDPLGAWKYVELCGLNDKTNPCPTAERELYNETNDRYETNNVAVASPAPGSVQAMLAARLAQLGQTQAPAPSFSSGPPPSTADTSASFAFSAVGASRYWCSLDGAVRSPCASPVSLPGPLAAGPHTFAVVAEGEDVPDGVTGTSASVVRSWTIDNSAPDTTITAGPSGPTASTAAQFSFASNEQVVTFRCSLDGAPFAACTSPASYPGLSEAPHTFAVKAVDAANNEDPTPDTRTWTVDVTAPDTSIKSGPSGATNQPGPYSFTFTSTEPGSTFQCRPSGGNFAACTSPYQYPAAGDGSYSLTVKATDPAGNIDPSPASRSFTVDTTPPPAPVLTQHPTDPGGPSATFAWTESDSTATFTCTLDGTPASCTSPATYPSLGNGSHAFSIVATDPAGNPSSPAQFSWSVSSSGPTVTITSGPAEGSSTTSTSATFKWSSDMQNTTYQCSLDGAPITSCASNLQYTGLADGSHTFTVRGTAAGTPGPPIQRTWTVDTTPPDTTILSGPSGTTASTGPFEFTFGSNEQHTTFKCKLDGSSFAPCPNSYDIPGPLSGTHTMQVKAVDAAGNIDATPAVGTWTVDTTPPPVPSITSKPPASTQADSASLAFSDTESGVTFLCSLDGAPAASCTSPQGYSSLAAGQHTFAVQAADGAGNVSGAATWQWTVDRTPPDTSITGGPPASTTSTTAQFTFTSTEGGSTFQCSLDGAAFATCSSPKSYSGLGPTGHTFAVRATDAAGNQDTTPDTWSWTVTPSTPETTIDSGPPAGGWTNLSSATFTFSSNIPGSTFQCSVDAAPFAPCQSGGAGASPTGLT